jgi:threonine synthase
MKCRSTKNPAEQVSLTRAVLESLPADRGLYVPETMPDLSERVCSSLRDLSFEDLAFEVIRPYFDEDLSESELREVVAESLTFDAPVVSVAPAMQVLELWHGPTLAFKDFGARFMARTMSRLRGRVGEDLTVLVATSGDTGAAVASGFYGVEGVNVWVLYPKGRVSPVQEMQLTSFGGNISAVEVDGTFDDCQALVKHAFLDPDLDGPLTLTSANSINLARLLPQMFYYFRAWQQVADDGVLPTFCVPSGNLGNLCAGLFARSMGLPVGGFVAATNVNDAFVRFLRTGTVPHRSAQRTLSNAMDVAAPSNLQRIEWLFSGSREALHEVVHAHPVTDDTTLEVMARVYRDHGYVLDPHTAVGWRAAELHREAFPNQSMVVLATAHPAKFPETVQRAIGREPELPEALETAKSRPRHHIALPVDYGRLRERLLDESTS